MNSDLWLSDNLVGGWTINKMYDEKACLIEEYLEKYWMFGWVLKFSHAQKVHAN